MEPDASTVDDAPVGRFGVTRRLLREELADIVGVRVGLAVDVEMLDPIITATLPEIGPLPDDGQPMHAREFADLAFRVLTAFGDPWTQLGPAPLFTAFYDLGATRELFVTVMDEIHLQVHLDNANIHSPHARAEPSTCFTPDYLPIPGTFDSFVHDADLEKLDRSALQARLSARLGYQGVQGCQKLVTALKTAQRLDPWHKIKRASTQSPLPLRDLFSGGQWHLAKDARFDQRYINFLAANLEDVDHIHWRQFERLTAEYFSRQGLYVELGPGGNDDGVDLRLWPRQPSRTSPPLIIVQCKRQHSKISKTVVKALWADVCAEGAGRGLVVTTSSVAPGAKKTIEARGYGLDIADGAAIRRWLLELRTLGTGVTSL